MPLPTLNPREVIQVAFLIQQPHHDRHDDDDDDDHAPSANVGKDGRMTLGQLNIEWRTAMGGRGLLTTGWLTFRKR